MNKIKIVHIVECAGGVDKYLRMLLFNLTPDLYDNVLICSHDYKREYYSGLVSGMFYTDMHNSLSLMNSIISIRQVRTLIKNIKPNIIYCHSSIAGGIGRIANIGIGIPVIYNPHGWAFNMPNGLKPKIYSLIERLLSKRTNIIVAISEFEKENALKKGITKRNKLQVIVSGIDLDKTDCLSNDPLITRSSLGIPRDAFVIGMTARICETKAPDIFIKSAAIIRKKIHNSFFVLIGDGDLRDTIENQIKEYNIENCVLITGWVDNPLPYVRLLDIGTLLSRWEGFGFALAEYMKLNIPIVATNVCAIPYAIKDGFNGILVEVDNERAVADAIIDLYENPIKRKKLTENGQAYVNQNFDIKRTAKEHELLFQSLLK